MNYSYLAGQSQNLASQLDAFFDLLEGENILNNVNDSCPRIYDITKYIPLWVVHEKKRLEDEQGQSVVTIFEFLQKYYDWLYCDTENGANYGLTQKLLDLIDIETTRKEFYGRFIDTYANGFDKRLLRSDPDAIGRLEDEDLVKFIKNISKNLYHRKTTIDGIRYFFKSLFPTVDEADLYIYYPKVNLLRLNGGKFNTESFTFKGITGSYESTNDLAGSYLNGSRLQDSNWFQDYSYLLKGASDYENVYTNMMHPAGLRVIFEKTIEEYPGPGAPDENFLFCERPILGNYASYRLGVTYNTQIGVGTYSGTTYALYGITYCQNCGVTAPFDNYPAHVFPNWAENIIQFRFNEINIFDFFNMCYTSGFTSPNAGLTCGIECAS